LYFYFWNVSKGEEASPTP